LKEKQQQMLLRNLDVQMRRKVAGNLQRIETPSCLLESKKKNSLKTNFLFVLFMCNKRYKEGKKMKIQNCSRAVNHETKL
jgi:hypothetical protein